MENVVAKRPLQFACLQNIKIELNVHLYLTFCQTAWIRILQKRFYKCR